MAEMYPEILIIMAEDLIAVCREKKIKLALAESCTGGLVAGCITSVSGSSDIFDRGFVTYSNQAKIEMLGVSENTLEKFGAVSDETAIAMAEGAIKKSGGELALSITGIAGPDGGSEEKPVGLVHIAVARKNTTTRSERHIFKGNRDRVRIQAVESG
ncbi:MAG: CinA family protein, partial [Rhodospirillaceae bacterium]|nr:CinA family protein [Rhodospirillaceae bacterium]